MGVVERLKAALAVRGNLSRIAEATRAAGCPVPHSTISMIASGKTGNPGVRTMERIDRGIRAVCPELYAEEVIAEGRAETGGAAEIHQEATA